MKQTKTLFLLSLLAALLLPFTTLSAQSVWDGTVATEFAGGTGTQDDPYLIEDGSQLAYLAKITNDEPGVTEGKYYKLIDDIILNEDVLNEDYSLRGTPANPFNPIAYFYGTFDGDGHVISGLYINDDSGAPVGLFGSFYGIVYDLAVVDAYTYGYWSTGIIVGNGYGGDRISMTRCYAAGNVIGYYAGLLQGGDNGNSTIEYCYCAGVVSSSHCAGGLAGDMYNNVNHCFAVAKLTSGSGLIDYTHGSVFAHLYYDKDICTLNSTLNETCYGKSTEEMQSEEFAELLGAPFVYAGGNYPYIEGLPMVGELTANTSSYRLCVGELTNGRGSKVKFFRNYDGTDVSRTTSRADAGDTVYLKVTPRKYVYLTENSLVVTGKTTGSAVTLTSVADGIWSFTMPESDVTVTASFYRDPNAPNIWDGSAADSFAGGTGTQDDPYLISNGEQLAYLAKITNDDPSVTEGKYYKLVDDIILNENLLNEEFDLNGTPENLWTPIADTYYNEAGFMGDFNGDGHCISGLYIVSTVAGYHEKGLFGSIHGNAVIHDLAIVDSHINGLYASGLVSGTLYDSAIITRCYVSGNQIGSGDDNIGLVAGYLYNSSKVEYCYAYGKVTGTRYVGGLLGGKNGGSISNSFCAVKMNMGYGVIGDGNYGNENLFYDSTVAPNVSAGNAVGKTTEDMQTEGFTELLGEPFAYADGNYPFIEGLPAVGEQISDMSGYRLRVGELANGKGSKVKFYLNYDGTDVNKAASRAEAGETVYVKVIPYKRMLITGRAPVVTNDATGAAVKLTALPDSIWSFIMPESTVTVAATFYRDPKAPNVWDGSTADSFAGGTGTEEDPYLIEDGSQLAYMGKVLRENGSQYKGAHFKLISNIVLNEDVLTDDLKLNEEKVDEFNKWLPIGQYDNPSDPLAGLNGYFDGNNLCISGIYSPFSYSHGGLFAFVRTGEVHNLTILDSYVKGATYVGGLTGGLAAYESYEKSEIYNCYVEACVEGSSYIGIAIGHLGGGNSYIRNCYMYGRVLSGSYKGSIAGYTDRGHSENCYSVCLEGVNGTGRVYTGSASKLYHDATVNSSAGYSTGKTTEEMQSKSFAELLGEPFVYAEGNYPYIEGLSMIGEEVDLSTSGFRLTRGAFVNGKGSSIKYSREFNGTDVGRSASRAEAGETVYVKVIPHKRMLLTDGSLKVVNDETGQTLKLTSLAENIWSFTMPEGSATVTAAFHRNPDLPLVWMGDVADSFAGGIGTQDDPYLISNGDELAYLAKLTNANGLRTKDVYYKLTADIILNEDVLTADHQLNEAAVSEFNKWTPIGHFTSESDLSQVFRGNLDGNGYCISGIYCPDNTSMAGLFEYIYNGSVHDLSILDSYIKASSMGGAIAGKAQLLNEDGTARVYNCYAEACVIGGTYMGIAVGYVGGGYSSVDHCYTYGRVSGSYAGGLVGYLEEGRVVNCYSVCKSGYNGVYYNYATVNDLYYDSTVNSNGRYATAKTTDEMQSEEFADLLGDPFEFTDGNYPYIDGLRQIGQGYTDKTTGYRTNVGAMANAKGCTIKFFTVDGDRLKVLRRSEAGEKVFLKPILTHHMLMAETSLVLTNDATGKEIALKKEGKNIYSFMMPDAEVTVTARFYANPKQALAWDGSVADSFAGGTGTQEDPYQISNGAELAYLAKITGSIANVTKGQYYRLTDDIVLNADVLDNDFQLIGTPQNLWTPIGSSDGYQFFGDFDGANHVISGVYATTGSAVGLFGESSGCIHNLAVVDSYVNSTKTAAGIICGGGHRADSISISHCYAEGSVYGLYAGLLVGGDNGHSTIEYSYCYGVVDSHHAAGGLIGDMYANMNHCFSVAKIMGSNGYGLVKITHSNTFDHLYYDKNLAPVTPGINKSNCLGKSTSEMQGKAFADLLGEPFAYSLGGYPYIPGLPKVGEAIEFTSAGYHVNIGTLTNTCGSSVGYYSEFDGEKVRKSIRSANTGETVYLKVDLGRRMLLTDGTLTVLNDTTGQVLTLTKEAEGIWSFTMPDFSVTVSASFHRDPTLPDVWEGDIAPEFAEGEGTEDDPYLIHDGAELAYLAQLTNANGALTQGKYYKLADDIILNEDVLTDEFALNGTPKNKWIPIGNSSSNRFQGTFDGDNHYITGVYINNSGNYVGFFGYTNNAHIRNLSLLDTYIYDSYTGGLIYEAQATDTSTVSRCYVEGNISASSNYNYCGGLISILKSKCAVENCYTSGVLSYGNKSGLVYSMNAGSSICNSFSAMKGATAIRGASDSVFNVYSDEDLGGVFSTKEDFCSKHTIEMHTTDFATRMGEPFEYVLGNYPYIPGLKKIGENRGWKTPEDPTHVEAGDVWDGERSVIFASGTGTEADPYIINNGAQLAYLAKLTNANGNLTKDKYYKLGADIRLNADSVLTSEYALNGTPTNIWEPIGKDESHKFQGVFDGSNHTISGLYIPSGSYVGFFGYTNNAHIRNLSLVDTYIYGSYSGGLIYDAQATDTSTVSHCYVEVNISASSRYNYCAGLITSLKSKCAVKDCYTNGLLGYGNGSGLVYSMTAGSSIRNCYSVMKGATAIRTANDSVFNVYSDEDLGGTFTTKEDFCSKHTIEMHTTDFATRMGEPFEYVLGNYPYIPGLKKIGEIRGWKTPEDPTHGGAGDVWDGERSIIFASGTGTEADPYIINNGAQLAYLAKLTNANGNLTKGRYYRLEADISLNENKVLTGEYTLNGTPTNIWEPIGKDDSHKFQGVFDGNNYTISGLYIPSGSYVGFFGYTNNAHIRNLSLVDTYIYGSYSGGLIYDAQATDTSTVSRCYVDVNISASSSYNSCAGLINSLRSKCAVENCYITGVASYGSRSALVYTMSNGSSIRNCYSVMKGAPAIRTANDSVFNVYFDSNRAGSTSNVRDDFRSAETPEMLSTDFAARMGAPFEYAVGYYPYIYGLHKIDENGKTSIVNGYSLQLGTLENGNDCTVAFYRGYKKKTKELSLPVVPGTKVFVDNATTIYVKVNSSLIKRLTDEGLIVTANTSGNKIEVTEVDYDLYSFQITNDAVTVAGAFLDGNFCGDPEVNNGRDVRWQLSNSKRKLTIEGAGNMVVGAWTPFANSIQTIEITEGVTSVASQAFKGMNKATTATLPATLTTIGSEAFSGCTATVDLRPCTLLTALHANEFAQFTSTLYLPATVTTIEADAFAGTYANVQHVYSPVADGVTLFANDVQVPDVDGMGDIARYGITNNQEVHLVWGTGYLVTAAANNDGALKVYADKALSKEILAGYKAVRTDDQTCIYIKVEPKNTKILFLNGLTVKAGNSTVKATQEGDDVFSFLMPKSAVTISAQFATGGYCGNTTVNNGHNLIWTLDGGKLAFQKNSFAQGEDQTMGNNAPWSTLGSNVKSVDLSGLKNIGSNAFTSCTNLVGLELPATPVVTVGDNAFAGQMVLIIPAESWDDYQTAGWAAYNDQTTKDKEILTLKAGMQWRTYYSKVGRMLPEGIKAYTITDVTADEAITSEPLNYIPAHQAVLIENKQKEAGTIEATTSILPNSQSVVPVCLLTTSETNLLQWLTEPTPVKVGQGYTLYKDEFVKVSTGTLPSDIAFLPAQGASASRLSIFNAVGNDELTGVDAVKTDAESGEWYTVDGKKLSGRPTKKGLYVKDGQKVVIR